MESEMPQEFGRLAERFIEKIQESGPPKTPPLVHAAVGAIIALLPTIVGLAYWSGTLSNRVTELESLKPRISEIERRSEGIQVLTVEIQAIRRDIERMANHAK